MKMRATWKYPLAAANEVHVKVLISGSGMPMQANVVKVAGRDEDIYDVGYVGTVRHADGIHVLHFFTENK